METIYSLKEIESTGYKSWTNFHLKIKSWSDINGIQTYEYYAVDGELAKIHLSLPRSIIESLFFEESRILLHQIGVTSFSELLEKHQDKRLNNGSFEFNVIVKGKNDEVFFKKILFEKDHVHELSQIEKKKQNYITYDQPKV